MSLRDELFLVLRPSARLSLDQRNTRALVRYLEISSAFISARFLNDTKFCLEKNIMKQVCKQATVEKSFYKEASYAVHVFDNVPFNVLSASVELYISTYIKI